MKDKIFEFRSKLLCYKHTQKILCILSCVAIALYIFIICSFSSRPKLFLLSYPAVGLIFLISILYIFLYYNRLKTKLSPVLLLPLFFVVFILFSTLIGTRDFSYFKTISLLIVTCYLSFICCFSIGNLKTILYVFAIPIFIFCIYYCIHYNVKLFSGQRLGADFGNENDVGLNLFFGFSISMVLTFVYKKYFMIVPSALMLFASFTTGSKKVVILSILFIFFLMIVLLKRRKLLLWISLGAIILALILVFSLPVFSDLRKRLLNGLMIFGESADASSINRFLFLKSSLYLGTKSFIFGYGGNGFAVLSGFDVYSHNNFGEILCDFGIIGVLLFYISYPFIGFCTKKKDTAQFLINYTFLGTFIFCSFTAVFFDTKIYYLLMGLCFYLNACNGWTKNIGLIKKRSYNEIII